MTLKNVKYLCALLIIFWSTIPTVLAEKLVVISSPDNVASLDIDDVARIFLGKVTQYPNGEKVEPLDLNPDDPSYAEFSRVVLKKNVSQLRAYWAKQVFTGKGRPPKVIANTDDLQDLVASDAQYLSYLDSSDITHNVRWVIELQN